MSWGAQNIAKLHIACSVFALSAGIASAQDAGGLETSLSFSQGLSYSDTDGTVGRTNLGFAFSSITRTESLELVFGTGIEQVLDDGLSGEIVDPNARLSYGIESRQIALNTDVTYRRSAADDFVEDPSGTPGILVLDSGIQENSSARLGLQFGREAPFGGNFSFGHSVTIYSQTNSPDLVNTDGTSADLDLRFDIDPRITATLGYSWSETNRATGRNVTSENTSIGTDFAVTPTWNASASLGLRRVSVTDLGVDSVSEGLSYSLNVSQDRPSGNMFYSLTSDLSEAGRRTTATIGITLETQRGQLSGRGGVTDGTDNTVRPLLTISYSEDLQRGSYSISLDQSFAVNSEGDETLNSRLRLGWQQNLNSLSSFSSNISYQMSDVLGADEDTERLEVGFGFSRALTEDWALSTRYTYSQTEGDLASVQRENEIFVGLETSLGWRP